MAVFRIGVNEEITPEIVKQMIMEHEKMRSHYLKLREMYLGVYEIDRLPEKDLGKPDNRIPVNFAKYITDTFNGYFIGNPVRVSHDSEVVNEAVGLFRQLSDMEDNEAELAKITSIYGHGYEYLYQDEDGRTQVTYNDPLDMFLVYEDTVQQKRRFGVRYGVDENGRVIGGILRTRDRDIDFDVDERGRLRFLEEKEHYYGDVPIVEYIENEDRQSIFWNVIPLMNALNKALSEKANDIDYFADAYMAVLGAEVSQTEADKLKQNRLLNIFGPGSESVQAFFLEKPGSDEVQENFLNRVTDLIYQTSMVANIRDESFGTASGVALEFKLQPMKNLATLKQRKFMSSMRERFKMIFQLSTNVPATLRDEWSGLRYSFSLNMPMNLRDEVETAVKLAGLSSEETALSVISVIDNPQEELERKKSEMGNVLADFDPDAVMRAAVAEMRGVTDGGVEQ